MSSAVSYNTLISELDRDIRRVLPTDHLEFCHKWFSDRLQMSKEQGMRGSRRVSVNALGFQQMGKSIFKRSLGSFTLGGIEDLGAPLAFDSRKRRMGIHGEPMDVEELQSISPCSSTSSTFENRSLSSSASSQSSSSPKSFSIPNIPLPLSPGRRRASNASTASINSRIRRESRQQLTPPLSPSTSDSDSDVESLNFPQIKYNPTTGIPLGYKLDRRLSVSSESLNPNATPSPKSFIPKSPKARARIEASVPNNLLFRNLSDGQLDDVFNAMKEVSIEKGVEVISQGAVGDFFYICESGSLTATVRSASTYNYISPGKSSTTPGQLSTQIATYGPGGSFGELALMYNAPRAATIVATTNCTLWKLDRVTFRSILMEHSCRKRKMYESFLGELPVLMGLKAMERTKIADALEVRTFEQGKEVVKEGLNGKSLFIIESGKAQVSRKRAGGEEEVLGNLEKGDSFGGLASIDSTIRAQGQLTVATVAEEAITRLLGGDLFK